MQTNSRRNTSSRQWSSTTELQQPISLKLSSFRWRENAKISTSHKMARSWCIWLMIWTCAIRDTERGTKRCRRHRVFWSCWGSTLTIGSGTIWPLSKERRSKTSRSQHVLRTIIQIFRAVADEAKIPHLDHSFWAREIKGIGLSLVFLATISIWKQSSRRSQENSLIAGQPYMTNLTARSSLTAF